MISFHVRRAGQFVTAGHESLVGAKATSRTFLQTNPAIVDFGELVDVIDSDGRIVGTWTADRRGKASWTAQTDVQLVLRFLRDYLALGRRDASPDDVLRLRTGWRDAKIAAALRAARLVLPSGIWRQGWTERVQVSK